jgi:hypothetical protein
MRTTLALLVSGAILLAGCGTASTGSSVSGRTPSRATLAAAEPAVTVVAVGDIACPPGSRATAQSCRQGATARVARAVAPYRVLALGDLQYQKGRYYGFTHSYAKSWGKLRRITFPIPGNHEYYTPGARGYFRYFKYRQPGKPGYYRRVVNGWQLYFLNSNCSKVSCAAQQAWLDSQMTAHPSTCSLIAFHHPRFSSGEHGSNAGMREFWDIAYRHRADVALSGHDHDYERFDPMNADGVVQPGRGIQQFVSGGGGRSLYPQQSTVPGSQKFISAFGVLKLSLRPSGYSWEFLDTTMAVRDSGSADCR